MRSMITYGVLGLLTIVGCGSYEPAAPPPIPESQQAKAPAARAPAASKGASAAVPASAAIPMQNAEGSAAIPTIVSHSIRVFNMSPYAFHLNVTVLAGEKAKMVGGRFVAGGAEAIEIPLVQGRGAQATVDIHPTGVHPPSVADQSMVVPIRSAQEWEIKYNPTDYRSVKKRKGEWVLQARPGL